MSLRRVLASLSDRTSARYEAVLSIVHIVYQYVLP